MDLHILWFVLVGVLFVGFFVLEGFDYGVGLLLPFIGKNDTERRQLINTIGPFWDANEVWLITAAGAMFAAFPNWYATMFSAFYPEFFGVLVALIIRGAAFEFRSQVEHHLWRRVWDWLIFFSSLLPGLLWGIIIANLMIGMPIDAHMNYVGNFWHQFNPYALLCGVTFVVLFALHGAIFLCLRLKGNLLDRAQHLARWLWLPTLITVLLFGAGSVANSDLFRRQFLNLANAPFDDLVVASLLMTGWLTLTRRYGWAFAMTTLTMLFAAVAICMGLFPNIMISSLNPAWNLTITNAASSPYTLTVMTWLALSALPLVLVYQGWNYWVFRKRLEPHVVGHY